MSMSRRRVRAIVRKEFREYRRNGNIIATMAVIPVIFAITPLVDMSSTAASTLRHENLLLYMLGIPAIVPAIVAAYSVAGERDQGTLEPVLTTPIRREEFLLAKELAVIVPSLAISCLWYGIVIACVALFGPPAGLPALLRAPDLLGLLLFTPLVAGWSIWIGIAISARMADVRAAAQLGAVRDGQLKVYGVLSPRRWWAAPEVPTLDELGIHDIDASFWHGLWAPADTPPEVTDKLVAAVRAALADPEVQERFKKLGQEIWPPDFQTPEALAAKQKAEIARWTPVIKEAGIKVE